MLTLRALRRFVIVSLAVVLAAPAILHGGANVWTGSRPAGEILSSAAQFSSSAADPDVVYSAQENRLLKSVDGGRTWTSIASFVEISSVHVSPASASRVYLGAARSGSAAGIFKSTDGGATWSQTLVANGGVSVDRIDSSAKHPNTIYASSYNQLYRSDDGGATWSPLTLPRGSSGLNRIIAALLVDPADGATPVVGGYDTDYPYSSYYYPYAPFFQKSSDAGATFTDLSAGLGNSSSVQAIAIDPLRGETIFVGLGYYAPIDVYRSEDGGTSWSPASTGLPPNIGVNSLVMDPQDSHTLYAGTNSGVYRTRDSGASWFAIGQQLSRVAVNLSLETSGRLRAGSAAGSSVFEIGAGPLDIAAGSGKSHLLAWDSDRLSVLSIDDAGQGSNSPPEGPVAGWLAAAIADGADGLSRVLWVNGDGRAALEIVGSGGSQTVFRFANENLASPVDVSVGADGSTHLLWTDVTGGMFLASVDAAGNATRGPTYGPYGSWTAIALADAPDGATWVLWRAADGRSSVSVHRGLVLEEVFRFEAGDLTAEDITVGADGRPRVLFVGSGSGSGSSGAARVATIDAQGNLVDAVDRTEGGRIRRIAAGADGLTRLLSSNGAGGAEILLLNPDNTLHAPVSVAGGPGS